jgi:hypothetical protein
MFLLALICLFVAIGISAENKDDCDPIPGLLALIMILLLIAGGIICGCTASTVKVIATKQINKDTIIIKEHWENHGIRSFACWPINDGNNYKIKIKDLTEDTDSDKLLKMLEGI